MQVHLARRIAGALRPGKETRVVGLRREDGAAGELLLEALDRSLLDRAGGEWITHRAADDHRVERHRRQRLVVAGERRVETLLVDHAAGGAGERDHDDGSCEARHQKDLAKATPMRPAPSVGITAVLASRAELGAPTNHSTTAPTSAAPPAT